MASRTIIVGDVHGCYEELVLLLRACDRRAEDEVISVGDLIDRGPDPEGAIRFFMEDANAAAICGNHEDKHVRIRSGELPPGPAQMIARLQLGDFYDRALDWFETLPLSLERHGHFICHAGVVPGRPLGDQPRQALLRGKMPWMKNIFDTSAAPWWERYAGETPVVYGHSVHRDGVLRVGNTWGLDTGACYGFALSALILPEARVVSVPATRAHEREVRQHYAEELEKMRGELERRREEERRRKVRAVKPRPVPPPVVEGVEVNGRWLLEEVKRRPGPWVGRTLNDLRARIDSGEIQSLADLRQVLSLMLDEA